jgi:hypothetical protein
MRRLETRPLEGFNEAKIDRPEIFNVELPDGRQLDYDTLVNNTPAVTSEYDGYRNPQLVLGTESGLPAWDEAEHFPVGRLDRIHGRTLEVLGERVEVVDEFKNVYGSLNIKGANLANPHFFRTLTAAREFIIHGLQESIVMERVIRASRLLRENGVDTEYICGLVLPETFPLDTLREDVGVDDKQPVTLSKLLEYMAGDLAERLSKDEVETRDPLEIKLDIVERFADCNYLITYRAVDCPYRLGELHDSDKYRQLSDFLDRHCAEGNQVAEYVREHPVDEFIARPLSYWVGENIGKMHKTGIYHKHPVRLNMTALGSIVDLDSCEGEPLGLGDRQINRQDETNDVFQAIRALQEELDLLSIDRSNPYAIRDIDDKKHSAGILFLRGYLENRFEARKDKVRFLADLLQYTDAETKEQDGAAVYRITEQVYDTYREFRRSHVPLEELDIYRTLPTPDFKRSDLLLSSVPPELFTDMREQIMDPEWTMNDAYEALKGEERPVFNPVKLLVKNLALEHIFSNYDVDGTRDAENMIFLGGAALGRVRVRSPERKDAVEKVRRFFDKQVELAVDFLADAGNIEAGLELGPLLKGPLRGFEGRIGNINMTGEGEPPIDIIYLKDQPEYATVFEAMGINEDTPIEPLYPATIEAFMDGNRNLFADAVLIADYMVSRWNSEQDTEAEVIASVFGHRRTTLPLLMIRGISSGKPEIFAYPTLFDENGPQPENYRELLEALSSPILKNRHDRLFDVDDTTLDEVDA